MAAGPIQVEVITYLIVLKIELQNYQKKCPLTQWNAVGLPCVRTYFRGQLHPYLFDLFSKNYVKNTNGHNGNLSYLAE